MYNKEDGSEIEYLIYILNWLWVLQLMVEHDLFDGMNPAFSIQIEHTTK